MNQAGKIAVKVHSASGLCPSPAPSGGQLGSGRQVYCVLEVPGYGRLCTEPAPIGNGPDEPTLWEQELTFEVGPSEDPKQLRAALYAVAAGQGDEEAEERDDDCIGHGSMGLVQLEEVQQQRHVRVPIATAAGAHLADLSLDLRFFHSRTPARQRDHLGRESINAELAQAGPTNAAKLLNERSPRSPLAAQRPGSPRIKVPQHDPPMPELAAGVRSTISGGEE